MHVSHFSFFLFPFQLSELPLKENGLVISAHFSWHSHTQRRWLVFRRRRASLFEAVERAEAAPGAQEHVCGRAGRFVQSLGLSIDAPRDSAQLLWWTHFSHCSFIRKHKQGAHPGRPEAAARDEPQPARNPCRTGQGGAAGGPRQQGEEEGGAEEQGPETGAKSMMLSISSLAELVYL